jgi:HK97 family phage major capsid protein
LRADDTIAVAFGALITNISWDAMFDMKFKVPSATAKQGIYVMHRTVYNELLQVKDGDSRYMVDPKSLVDINGNLTMPWGDRVVLSDVMPDSAVIGDSNEPYVVYGNFKRCRVYRKKGFVIDYSTDATVTDSESGTVKLFEQDMNAIRVKFRELCLHKFPDQFAIGGTGTVS